MQSNISYNKLCTWARSYSQIMGSESLMRVLYDFIISDDVKYTQDKYRFYITDLFKHITPKVNDIVKVPSNKAGCELDEFDIVLVTEICKDSENFIGINLATRGENLYWINTDVKIIGKYKTNLD